MILVDFSNIIYSGIFAHQKQAKDMLEDDNGIDLFRHIVLNTIRSNVNKHKSEYDDVVLCIDSSDSWRKQYFPEYKANRKINRAKDGNDWSVIFAWFKTIIDEIREYMPYRVIKVDGTEADDIIAVICKHESEKQHTEPILIISEDKDLVQCQRYGNGIRQYAPRRKKMLVEDNPEMVLAQHILKGDSSDGIPNILSDGDTFITEGKRQTPLSKKKMSDILMCDTVDELVDYVPGKYRSNYDRNRRMIDLDMIPNEYQLSILDAYQSAKKNPRMKIMTYFGKYRLKEMLEKMNEF